jgi:regulator of protease activity HflC (stomatin/prohibitin superfamily)
VVFGFRLAQDARVRLFVITLSASTPVHRNVVMLPAWVSSSKPPRISRYRGKERSGTLVRSTIFGPVHEPLKRSRSRSGLVVELSPEGYTMFALTGFLAPFILVVLLFTIISASIRVLRQYERGVMFTLGRFSSVRGPGLIFMLPWVQQIVRVDLRTVVMEVPKQDVISRDNVSINVDAVLYFHVIDPEKAVIAVEQYVAATNMLAQTTLRSVLGQHELDEMLAKRAILNKDVQDILDTRTKEWGIEVSAVEIRDVQLTENMVKAIAKQAEAERDRRAKVIHAEAEFQAAQTLTNAATILASVPAAMQLRYLQTLSEIGGEHNSTVVFPMPLDIVKPFLDILNKDAVAKPSTNGIKVPTLS